MKALSLALLADENIHPGVVATLRSQGRDVAYVREGHVGTSDREVLRLAVEQGRAVLTHDSDFGRLALLEEEPSVGIIYLRPGHIDPAFTLAMLAAIEVADIEVVPPFLLVAERREDSVRIRLR